MSKLETNTIDTVSGTSTLQVGSTNTTTITLGASGDTINIPSGATITNNGTQTGFGGVNTPAFFATTSAQQTITNSTDTKIQFANEVVDTDNCYDPSTNYRFTPTTSGKYFCYLVTSLETSGGLSSANFALLRFKKNGSLIYQSYHDNSNNNGFAINLSVNAIIDLNGSSDYLEAFVYANASSGNLKVQSGQYSLFGAYKIIE